jgi:hypothetical protein
MTFDTAFVHKVTGPLGWFLGKNLGINRMGNKKYKRSHDDNCFLHNDPLKPAVKIAKLTM